MNSVPSKKWENVPFETWEYGEQTKIKHQVLRYYIPQWLGVLSSFNKRLNYIDGFGGIGAYHTDKDLKGEKYLSRSYGSPVFSTLAINEFQMTGHIKEANILIIDTNKKNLTNIRIILKAEGIDPERVDYINGDFDKNINKLLDKVEKLAPTFFVVDPFGYSQIKINTLKRIMMGHRRSEILLNFMYNGIQRGISCPGLDKHFDSLFGCSQWRNYIDEATKEKEKHLVDLFRNNCKQFSKFVYPFRLSFPNRNMSYYYLFHLSNHRKACILMKDSFAKINQGDLEYKGVSSNQLSLNLFEDENNRNWKEHLLICFKNTSISYGNLLDKVIDEVPLTERSIKKMLQVMEEEKKIEIDSGQRRRKKGIEEEDIIFFK